MARRELTETDWRQYNSRLGCTCSGDSDNCPYVQNDTDFVGRFPPPGRVSLFCMHAWQINALSHVAQVAFWALYDGCDSTAKPTAEQVRFARAAFDDQVIENPGGSTNVGGYSDDADWLSMMSVFDLLVDL